MMQDIGERLGLDRAAVGHALRMFVAAMLAFAIASLFHVKNAYWAAMPIWVVAQAQRGLLFERALFRITGTLLGAAAGFGILWATDQALMALALLGVWVAVSSGLTRILRGVHNYGALMAGITAAVVVMPSLLDPSHLRDIAIARVECTLIGVIVVTFVTGAATPEAPRAAFYARVRELAGDAVGFVATLLGGGKPERSERRILYEISEVEAAASLVTAGSIEGYRRIRHVDAFIAASLAMMAVGQTLALRRSPTEWAQEPLLRSLTDFAARLRSGAPSDVLDPEWQQLLGGARRIDARLAAALEQFVAAEAALFSGAADGKDRAAPRTPIRLAPHYDMASVCRTGLVSGGATFLSAAAGLISGWSAAELAALGVCIFSMILGSVPKPRIVAPAVLTGVTIGVIVATFYRFVIQPHVVTVPELILSITPFILVGAFARASRKTALPALDANMCFLLASQAVLPAVTDPRAILSGGAALLLAAGVVATGFLLFSREPRSHAVNAARTIVRDLQRLVSGAAALTDADWQARSARQILKLILHLGHAGELRDMAPGGILAALNLGTAIVDLQDLSRRYPADTPSGKALADALALLAGFRRDSQEIANELFRRAQLAGDAAVAQAMRDAAHALLQCAPVFALA